MTVLDHLTRFSQYPGACSVNHHKSSFHAIARRILDGLRTEGGLPCTVEQAIERTYREGWFTRVFYDEAIAGLIHTGALVLDGEQLAPGPRYTDWLQEVDRYLAQVERSRQYYDQRMQVYDEGKKVVYDQFVPDAVKGLVGLLPVHGVVRLNSRNRRQRLVPGASVWVEFGKRHHVFDSVITGQREQTGGSWYVMLTLVGEDPQTPGNYIVSTSQDDLSVEHWRLIAVPM